MAEYKFSCPQCGQHLQCAVGSIGAQINCPTCQQPIIIPPPTVSVSKASVSEPVPEKGNSATSSKMLIYAGIFGISVGLAIIAGAYFFGGPHKTNSVTQVTQKKQKLKGDTVNLGDWVKGPKPPAWLKLVRSGNKFTGYYSTNGSTWTLLCATNITMNGSVLAGLAVTDHNNALLNTTKFDNVMMGSPTFLNDVDVGAVGFAGSASLNDGVYTIKGGGTDIFGNDDQFNFDYQSVNGDVTLIARVMSVDAHERFSKSGVMIRENLATNSVNIRVVISPANGVCMEARLHN
jgi:hypothetical protein